MLGALVLFSVGLLGTIVLGVPLATRLAQVQAWRNPARPDPRARIATTNRVPFVPVDFGPDPLKWPSQIPRTHKPSPNPPWPSAHWNDPHFGKAARALTARSAAAAEQVDQQADARRQQQAEARRQQDARRQEEARQQSARRQEARQPRQGTPQRQRGEATRPQPPRQPSSGPPTSGRAPSAPPQAPRRPQPVGDGLPDRARLEAMVGELGLAGTVQQLMQSQGWDFKEAAGWLARMRKG